MLSTNDVIKIDDGLNRVGNVFTYDLKHDYSDDEYLPFNHENNDISHDGGTIGDEHTQHDISDDENSADTLSGGDQDDETPGWEMIDYDPVEGYTDFRDLDVMTITMMGDFKEEINNIKDMFYLMPIMRVPIKKPSRRVKKIKLPYPGHPGIIMTVQLGKEIRGVIKSINTGSWDHSIMTDMSVTGKNINMKVSRTNIQMCGAKSIEMGIEATHLIIEHINKVANSIELMREHSELATRIIVEFICDCTTTIVPVVNDPTTVTELGSVDTSTPVKNGISYSIGFDVDNIIKKRGNIDLSNFTEEDLKIRDAIRAFLYHELTDVFYLSDAVNKIEWIRGLKPILTNYLEYDKYRIGMIKYRFRLGFKVDLQALDNNFSEEDSDFYSNYLPDIRNYAVVELECRNVAAVKANGKKKDVKKHTFSIQQGGHVTHSCGIYEEMETVYYKFINAIAKIRHLIEIRDPDLIDELNVPKGTQCWD